MATNAMATNAVVESWKWG